MREIFRRPNVATMIFILLLSLARSAPAQTDAEPDLFAVTWSEGVPEALVRYRTLPASIRSPDLLLQAADQLLWTGKEGEALELLAEARREAPERATVLLQQARAFLQRGEYDAARAALGQSLDILEADTTLDSEERELLRRKLENRVRLLDHRASLLDAAGAYEAAEGRILLLKFDPYINTFPSLLDLQDGTVRILYPQPDGQLYYRGEDDRTFGVAVKDEGSAGRTLQVETAQGLLRARDLGLKRETMRFVADEVSIEGTLVLPTRTPPPYTAIVLAHGAGLSTRYNLMNEALAYAAEGVAALVYDKPGLGASTGENWLLLSIDEQADHVEAAVTHLKRRADIGEIGVWGFSQGGWVAPLTASRTPEIDFVVMAAGAAVGPQEQSTQSMILAMEKADLSEDDIDGGRMYLRELWSRVNAGFGSDGMKDLYAAADTAAWGDFVPRLRHRFEFDWWRANKFDAGGTLEKLEVPALAILGENDAAVPPRDNVPLLARHLSEAPMGDYTIALLPEANHQFMRGDDYQPLYFSTIVGWVADRFVTHDR